MIPERRSAEITAVACKASAGAVEHLRIAHVRNLADWLGEAKHAGFWIWGADAAAKQAPWDVDLSGPTVLVLGGEGRGIRPRSQPPATASSPFRSGSNRFPKRLCRRHRAALRGNPSAR